MYGYGPSGSLVSSSQNKVISESSCSLTMLTMLGATACATTRRTTERASRALRRSDTAPAAHSGSQDHRTPMSTFERLRRHETVRPRLGALVYFKHVLTYKCNLLVIRNNA